MKRRSFLSFLGLAPIAAKLATTATVPVPPSSPSLPMPLTSTAGSAAVNIKGCIYKYYQADVPFRRGELVYTDSAIPIGIAINNVDKDHYGFVQVLGPYNPEV